MPHGPPDRQPGIYKGTSRAFSFKKSPGKGSKVPEEPSPRHTMDPPGTLLALLLLTCSVSLASPLRNGFWDDLSQLTRDKENLEQTPPLTMEQGKTNLKETLHGGSNYVGNILQKLFPLNRGIQPWVYQDANGLRQLIKGEIESLQMKLSTHVDEVHHEISQNLENLRLRLTHFTQELLVRVSFQAKQLHQHFQFSLSTKTPLPESKDDIQRFAASYAKKIAFLTDRVKETFHPYADRLRSEINHSMEELLKNVAPQATASGDQLGQYIREFSEKLSRHAKNLHQKMERSLERLTAQLSLHSSTLWAWQENAQRGLEPSFLEYRSREVLEGIEEFKKDVCLELDDFTRTMDSEMAEAKLKLSSPPLPLVAFPENFTPLEDWHARLSYLWKDISQSLNEPSSSY